jgi:ABC-type transport system involved in multi-copper enzyme maturation permease subunit
MTRSTTNLKAIVRLVLSTTFRFPILEGLLVIFSVVIGYLMLFSDYYGMFFIIRNVPMWDGSELLEDLSFLVETVPTTTFASTLFSLSYLIMFLLPMLIAFDLGGGLESGFLRTLLSYPISRNTFLICIGGVAILLTGFASSLSLISLILLFPQPFDWFQVALHMCSLWSYVLLVGSSAVIISIIFRSARLAILGSIGFWFVILFLSLFSGVDLRLLGFLNPILMSVSYTTGNPNAHIFGEIMFSDVILSLIGSILFGFGLFLASLVLFRRTEI